MNYTLQLHGERIVYPVPPGLYDLMSDIAREVLRDQPTFVYKYIANYLETLIKVRKYSKQAGHLIADIMYEAQEPTVYVQSLGLSWEVANNAALKIQTAYKKFNAKRELKRLREEADEDERQKALAMGSESFREYLKTQNIDLENATKAADLIKAAYKTYSTKRKLISIESEVSSSHTVDVVTPKPPPIIQKPTKRDSKLLVFQQSPAQSYDSTWSTLAKEVEEEKIHKKSLGFQKSASMEHDKYSSRSSDSHSQSDQQDMKYTLPSYYDTASTPKVPMISETGQLETEPSEIVTLFSTDSLDDIQDISGLSDVDVPSFLSIPSSSKPELAKQVKEILGNRSAQSTLFIDSVQPLDEKEKRELGQVIKKKVSKVNAVAGKLSGKLESRNESDIGSHSSPINEIVQPTENEISRELSLKRKPSTHV